MPNGSFWLFLLVEFLTEKLCKTDAEVVDVLIGSALNFDQFAAEKLCKNDVEVVAVPVGSALIFD